MFFACLLKHVHKFVSPDSEGMIKKNLMARSDTCALSIQSKDGDRR